MKTIPRLASREEAGRALANRLAGYSACDDVLVLALPDGGVPVGVEIAAQLRKPFDILLMERITAPHCNRMHLGAITHGGVRMLDFAMIDRLHLDSSQVRDAVLAGSTKLAHREEVYRGHSHPQEIADHTVILVDDGTASCSMLRDAIRLLRRQHAEKVIVAVPSACRDAACDIRLEADEMVTLVEPVTFRPIRNWHRQLPKTTVEEVHRLLSPAGHSGAPMAAYS